MWESESGAQPLGAARPGEHGTTRGVCGICKQLTLAVVCVVGTRASVTADPPGPALTLPRAAMQVLLRYSGPLHGTGPATPGLPRAQREMLQPRSLRETLVSRVLAFGATKCRERNETPERGQSCHVRGDRTFSCENATAVCLSADPFPTSRVARRTAQKHVSESLFRILLGTHLAWDHGVRLSPRAAVGGDIRRFPTAPAPVSPATPLLTRVSQWV